MKIRKSNERGFFDHGFLKTYHTFSFGDYYDPNYVQYRSLRVINEDFIAPNSGFPTHPHKNMEIITLILEGELSHKDSTGQAKAIGQNQLQWMSAGRGITHSEFNASKTDPIHLLQIWITPNQKDLNPDYAEITLNPEDRKNTFQLVASEQGPLKINQDAKVFLADIDQDIEYKPASGRGVFLHLINGSISVNGQKLGRGDAVSVENESLDIKAHAPSRIILFDMI